MARTFYLRQVTQLRYLTTLAYHEALAPPRFPKRRYQVTCICYACDIRETRSGAIEAVEFLCQHNRHSTYIKGVETP